MAEHPLLVAGEGRACSELMAAMAGGVAVKMGAEAVYVAILPERGLGVALKVEDGGLRGAECAIAALLVRLGALEPGHPAARRRLGPAREAAIRRLVPAMLAHPLLVAGEGRACSELMPAMQGRAAVKTGAEAVFVAILPERGLGVALKIEDGATRASESAIAAILVRLGVLDPGHPAARRRLDPPIVNRRGIVAGSIRPDPAFYAEGRPL
jgi:L-asparaginase II